ncbi:MAG: efflux RND transporter periplasmic adaptor subunit [Treponema sp.]|nr:efflux RND transporter periplasmic adaptor subunit [Treponema sp.]
MRGTCVCLSLALLGAVLSCGKNRAPAEGYVPKVKVAAAAEKILAEEVSGFGALSFFTKVDVAVVQDGTVRRLYYREGDSVPKGARIADLENVQLELAAARAENSLTQAQAALRLARSRLLEGEFSAEAELLGIARAGAELVQAAKVLEEQRRKQEDQETLYAAGGLSDEAIREGRFSLSGAEEQFRLMERDLEIRTVGLRDRDLAAAGLLPPEGFASEEDRRAALIALAVSTLRSEAEAAEAQLEAAEKELESVRIARSELTVYSPAGGTLGARYFEEGERVKKEDKLITLMDTGSLYVLFSLRENDALRLRKGMAARVGVGEAVYEGTVDLVSPQADSQSFTFTVRVLLPPSVMDAAENKLKPGMFARVTVHLGEERKALAVPESAVVNRQDDEGTAFAVTQGRVSERKVRFGPSTPEGEREILSGLAPGEVVVLKPEAYLKEGSRVIPE